ncbi:MAG: GNAT family N-acetyltransferase [Erysipelothrix sp.]
MKTERLVIRDFEDTDTDYHALFMIMNDAEVNRYLPWYPLGSAEEALDFYAKRILARYVNNNGFYFAVCLKEDNIPIGYITVSGDDSHDFGYGLRKEYWNQGIITEASNAVIEELVHIGYRYVTATHDINNVASGKVMINLGMEYKYSYVEMWQPKNIQVTFRMYQLNFDGVERTFDKYWNMYENHFIESI